MASWRERGQDKEAANAASECDLKVERIVKVENVLLA